MGSTGSSSSEAPRGDPAAVAARTFAAAGEMAARCRAVDWAATPLGPVDAWPAELRTAVRLMLATPVATSLWCGPSYTLLYNDAYRPILGVKHPEALGRSGAQVWAELWPALEAPFERVRAGGAATYEEEALLPMQRLPGGAVEDTWFTYSLSALTDDAGACVAVFNLAVENTGRVLARHALATERARLFETFRRAPSFVSVVSGPDHVLEYANEAYFEFVGRRDIIGRPVWEALPDARDQGFEALLDSVRDTGVPVVGRAAPLQLVRTPGAPPEERFVDFVCQTLTDASGVAWGVMGYGTDVTDHVRARRQVERLLADSEESRQRTEAVLGSIADAFYLLDRDWRFTYVNDAAEPLLRTTRGELHGRTLWDAFPAVEGSVFEGPYRAAMASGRSTSVEAYFEPLGTWFDVRSYPWSGGLMVHFRDVGARKAAEAERERLLADAEAARAEAEAANRAKGEFLATMSHELRTPLNAIGGYAEPIELGIHGVVTPGQRQALERIRRSQRHLLGLINGVLNYTRVEAGAVHYDVEAVALDEALATCEVLTAPQLRGRALTFHHERCDPTLAARADREKLHQIVLNLLTNAVKFTEPGGRVALRCTAAGDTVRIVVSDTGRGIPTEQLARVFEPFVQIDARLTRTEGGVGLGLAISRDLARGMGGDLTAASTLGAGSSFTLTLPRA